MTQPTTPEIVEALKCRLPEYEDRREILANRIQAHGIAPPDGMVLVPIDPTAEMLDWMGIEADSYEQDKRHYKAMLAAAPKPEVKP